MSTTILRPLANSKYQEGKGVLHFYPFLDENDPTSYGPGVRIGDMDSLTLTVEVTDGDTRFSNEYATRTAVLTPVSEVTCRIEMVVAQQTETAIQAVLMGKRAPFVQAAQTDLTKSMEAGDIVFLGGLDVMITEATLADTMEPANPGVDYIIDAPSGQIEAVRAIDIIYSIPAFTDRFRTGVASGQMPKGLFVFRGVAAQGEKSVMVLHSSQLKPGGGYDMIADGIVTTTITGTCTPIGNQEEGFSIGYVTKVPA